jgi:acetoin utilization deacetylase AcuC-like enzyme
LAALDEVLGKRVNNAFCAVRPPGHHAETERAMGFCIFNNVAIGARYAQMNHKLKKILIVDWDAHHGNGTQHIFYEDPTVFYFSVHQFPHYPGTGSDEEEGEGEGKGFTLNMPMCAGSGDLEYIEVFENILYPEAIKFSPDLILISAGFDGHKDDPLSNLNLSAGGFKRFTQVVLKVAEECCEGRVVSVLEGGYNLKAFSESISSHLSALIEGSENRR